MLVKVHLISIGRARTFLSVERAGPNQRLVLQCYLCSHLTKCELFCLVLHCRNTDFVSGCDVNLFYVCLLNPFLTSFVYPQKLLALLFLWCWDKEGCDAMETLCSQPSLVTESPFSSLRREKYGSFSAFLAAFCFLNSFPVMVCLTCWQGKLGWAYVCVRFRLNTVGASEDLSMASQFCNISVWLPWSLLYFAFTEIVELGFL